MSSPAETPTVPVWHCDLKALDGLGATPLTALTVGAKFEMDCTGDIAVAWKGRPEIVLPEKTPEYSLYILATPKLESNAAQLIVTAYRPGQAKPEFVRVMAGDTGFEASGLEWNVQSVVKQGQEAKPYGPFGPFALGLPGWVWLALACVLAAIAGGVWIWFSKAQKKRRLRDDLANFSQAALSPSAQFHKELRVLSRKLVGAKDTKDAGEWNMMLDRSIRIFLLREFQFLTLKATRGQTFSRFRKQNRAAFDAFATGLEKVFSEMDRFQSHAAQHKPGDFEQILRIALKWCDEIEKQKVKRQ